MKHIAVMQMVDSLDAGGTERVAVNLANLLPRDRYRVYLCTTRRGGPLSELLSRDVGRLNLNRQRPLDIQALSRLVSFNEKYEISLLHAHSSSLFTARLAALFPPYPKVLWHDHYGRYAIEERPLLPYRFATRHIGGVIAVNQPLVQWSQQRLGVSPHRVWYLRNFVSLPEFGVMIDPLPDLPGEPGQRMVCVANLRPEKDHLTLFRAMGHLARRFPKAHLLCVGAFGDAAYLVRLRAEIERLALTERISLLGSRQDVSAILRACDMGVLSSASEGLPLALIEYGMAGLPVVATRVGQCAEVLEEGLSGKLVPPGSPEPLAEALGFLLERADERKRLAERFHAHVRSQYSAGPVLQRLDEIYNLILEEGNPHPT